MSFRHGYENKRFDFRNSIMDKLEKYSTYVNDILWTGECTFSRTAIVTRQYTHFWSQQNPYVIRSYKQLVEPFFVENTLTGNKYADLFRWPLSGFLDDQILLADVTKLWFQHDGTPVHKVAPCRNLLCSKLQDNVIG